MSRWVTMAGWEHAPHLSAEDIADMAASIPEHEIEARSKGWPALGSGNIYQIPESKIKQADFDIPEHWPQGYGMDVGWKWTAAAWFTRSPETKVYYLHKIYKKGRLEPSLHAAAIQAQGAWLPGVIDPAANGRGQKDGWQLLKVYRDLGLHLSKANSSVEGGVLKVQQLLNSETLKVFASCLDWWEEFRKYRRDFNGNIVKKDDHLLDCTKYFALSGLDLLHLPNQDDGDRRHSDEAAAEAAEAVRAGSWMI